MLAADLGAAARVRMCDENRLHMAPLGFGVYDLRSPLSLDLSQSLHALSIFPQNNH